MALGDSLRRALRGQPNLRRQLRGMDEGRLTQGIASLEGLDPKRWKNLYRRELRTLVENETAAAPMLRREELESEQKQAMASGDRREYDRLGSLIRSSTPRYGSVEQRNDPRRYGSAASRRFRGLY